MKVLVLNRGSSSIKCCLYSFTKSSEQSVDPLWEAHLQWKNSFEGATLKIKNGKGAHFSETVKEKSSTAALEYLIPFLCKGATAVLSSLGEINAVGHRIVHGGSYFKESVLIDANVKEKIGKLSELAPLHNLADLEGIEVLERMLGAIPQIAVFDTAFHHTMPQAATVYPGPYKWFEDGIKRYGFHGTSFQYCTRQAIHILKETPKKMVICHLGSGASLCAVKEGKSVDTTMGFTPLEGLMMDTRSGSIDPGIILHLMKKNIADLSNTLYKESGLLGISGFSSDMRDIIEKGSDGNKRAALALEVYMHRLNSLIGSMAASLGGLDVLVFTAGIGENAPLIRRRVCEAFSFLGVKLDQKKNGGEDSILSAPSSAVKVLLIHTQESFEIARECWRIQA